LASTKARFDETKYAREIASRFHTKHLEERVTAESMLEIVPKLGEILDEPMADGSIVPTFILSRLARRHVTVAIGGDGGDELFAGYPTYVGHRIVGSVEAVMPEAAAAGDLRALGSQPTVSDGKPLVSISAEEAAGGDLTISRRANNIGWARYTGQPERAVVRSRCPTPRWCWPPPEQAYREARARAIWEKGAAIGPSGFICATRSCASRSRVDGHSWKSARVSRYRTRRVRSSAALSMKLARLRGKHISSRRWQSASRRIWCTVLRGVRHALGNGCADHCTLCAGAPGGVSRTGVPGLQPLERLLAIMRSYRR